MTDAISRSAVLDFLTNNIVIREDEIDLMEEVCHTIKVAPALDAVPVVHEKDIRSSVITVKDSDEWQDRIILADEATQVCAVYYADDSDAVPVDTVADMLAYMFNDECPCNYNDIDEWLPQVCENTETCPDVVGKHSCWKQFIKHWMNREGEAHD